MRYTGFSKEVLAAAQPYADQLTARADQENAAPSRHGGGTSLSEARGLRTRSTTTCPRCSGSVTPVHISRHWQLMGSFNSPTVSWISARGFSGPGEVGSAYPASRIHQVVWFICHLVALVDLAR
ncbi:hypothetical protein GCM10010094_05420 [Streptomyces flaveus]|uniref:Uncharacterized protein n=1 Tax=Streptomyces flaveus TaxID=66370 RepID=A0A917QFI7_9ACTN|nr:hypothetical protein GCM10010094_05420 [Streptomyces flaveus]